VEKKKTEEQAGRRGKGFGAPLPSCLTTGGGGTSLPAAPLPLLHHLLCLPAPAYLGGRGRAQSSPHLTTLLWEAPSPLSHLPTLPATGDLPHLPLPPLHLMGNFPTYPWEWKEAAPAPPASPPPSPPSHLTRYPAYLPGRRREGVARAQDTTPHPLTPLHCLPHTASTSSSSWEDLFSHLTLPARLLPCLPHLSHTP